MADKIASGSWSAGPPSGPGAAPAADGRDRGEEERLTAKRDNARWTGVVGFAMLFAASFHVGFAIGGMLMAGYGGVASIYWGRRLRKAKGDPWAYDPDLDGPEAADWRRR
jgi:hypothetical protein